MIAKRAFLLIALAGSFLYSPMAANEQLVNRRVLLVNFANLQEKDDFEYLEVSIPEAMLGALNETKNFDLLPADTWSNLVQSGEYTKKDTGSDKRTRSAAMSRSADVVVLGSFVNIDLDLKIVAKAVEVESGRVIVSKSVQVKTDGTMFQSIDALAKQLAQEMKTKLPPLPPREIIRNKVIYKSQNNAQEQPPLFISNTTPWVMLGTGNGPHPVDRYNFYALEILPYSFLFLNYQHHVGVGLHFREESAEMNVNNFLYSHDTLLAKLQLYTELYTYRSNALLFNLGFRYGGYNVTENNQGNQGSTTFNGDNLGLNIGFGYQTMLFPRIALNFQLNYIYEPMSPNDNPGNNLEGAEILFSTVYRQ